MPRRKKRHSNSEVSSSSKRIDSGSVSIQGFPSQHTSDSTTVDNLTNVASSGYQSKLFCETNETLSKLNSTETETIDILGNGLLTKKVLIKGLGRESRPNHGDLVEVSFKGCLEDGTIVDDVNSMSFILGDGDVIQALDLSLPLAERDEHFELLTDARFAYGIRGRDPDIPADAKLRYEVHLLSSSEPPCYSSMSDSERLRIADQKRERGNYYYRREEYAFAVNSYNKALKVLSVPASNRAFENESHICDTNLLEELEIKLLNNLAATQLKIQAYDAAVKSCDAVLSRDPRNFKAIFRKGKALLEQGEVDEAVQSLRLVSEIVPSSSLVAYELQRARSLQQRERERWSRAASKMFPQLGNSRRLSTKSRFRICRDHWLGILYGSFGVLLIAVGLAWYLERIPSFDYVTFH